MDAVQITARLHPDDLEILAEKNREIVAEEIRKLWEEVRRTTRYFDANETADILGVSRVTVMRWREKGMIQGNMIGGKWLFADSEIEQAKELGYKYKRHE